MRKRKKYISDDKTNTNIECLTKRHKECSGTQGPMTVYFMGEYICEKACMCICHNGETETGTYRRLVGNEVKK